MGKVFAVIPARAGSKRIKNKNIVDFHGKAIIEWPLGVLLKHPDIKEVFVSSDSQEILDVSSKAGAKSIFRSPELSGDHVGIADVVRDFIKSQDIEDSDTVMCVFATNVWLSDERIFEALELLRNKPDSMVLGVGRYNHPISRRLVKRDFGYVMVESKKAKARTQDEQTTYFDTGYFYLASKKTWLQRERIFDQSVEAIELDRRESIDIDTESDLEFAKMVFGGNGPC